MGWFSRLIDRIVRDPLGKLAIAIGGSVLDDYTAQQVEQVLARVPPEYVMDKATVASLPPGSRVVGVAIGMPGQVNAESFFRRTGKLAEAEASAILHASQHG